MNSAAILVAVVDAAIYLVLVAWIIRETRLRKKCDLRLAEHIGRLDAQDEILAREAEHLSRAQGKPPLTVIEEV